MEAAANAGWRNTEAELAAHEKAAAVNATLRKVELELFARRNEAARMQDPAFRAMATLAGVFPKPVGRRTMNRTRDIDDDNISSLKLPSNLSLVRKIGAGSYGDVWLVKDRAAGRWWAVKHVAFHLWGSMDQQEKDFQNEVRYQKKFAAIGCAPGVQYHWYTEKPKGGCIQMQPIEGIVGEVARDKRDDSDLMGYLASQILQLYNKTKQAGLGHGDPHFQNIAIELSVNRKVPSLKYIDFGRSFTIPDRRDVGAEAYAFLEDADRFWVWRACIFNRSLHKYLVAVGFPGSSLMERIVGVEKPSPEWLANRPVDGTPLVHKLMAYQEAAKN